ncbi:MAG: FAD-dependent oxidoreductase [bacterium]
MTKPTKSQKIAIIGSGISGLVAGYELTKQGFEVEVFEKQNQAGGRAISVEVEGLNIDSGASFLMDSYDQVYAYLKEFDLLKQNQNPKAILSSTVVLKDNKLQGYSLSVDFLSITERIKFLYGLWKMNRYLNDNKISFFEPWSNPKNFVDSPAKQYLLEHFDSKIVDYFFEPGIRCVQFHSTEQIGTQSLLAFLKNGVPKNGIKYFTIMPEYIGKYAEVLASKQKIHLNQEILVVERMQNEQFNLTFKNGQSKTFDQIILNTTPDIIQKIYPQFSPNQGKILAKAEFSQSITVVFKLPKNLISGFYLALVPFVENEVICSYTNEQMKGENYTNDEFAVVNVYLHEEAVAKYNLFEKTDSQIFDFVKKEFIKVAPFLESLNEAQKLQTVQNLLVQKWPLALSKSPVDYIKVQSEFWENGQGENGVWFAGDWVGGSWLEGCTRTGQKVAGIIATKQI